jgi:hypothetical protein
MVLGWATKLGDARALDQTGQQCTVYRQCIDNFETGLDIAKKAGLGN